MPTLNELFQAFGGEAAEHDKLATERDGNCATPGGATKTASEGSTMNSLHDIYSALAAQDLTKEAAVAAQVPEGDDVDVDFAKMAAAIADAEAGEIVDAGDDVGDEEPSEDEIMKVASEYDAAGRIMARGFYDEFQKLAGNLDTDVTPNQMTESPSAASTPALGDRGLPTVPTNFAGSDSHDKKMETGSGSGVNPKDVYKDALKEQKAITPGVTGDKPFAAAQSMPGLGGFATIRNINVKPA